MSPENSDLHQDMGMAEEEKLKYLQFVQVAAIHFAMCFSSLYSQGKEKSGPLKPSVETIEGTVKNVVGPVFEKYHDVPIEVLKFVDTQVDKSVTKLERRVPPVVKQVSAKALSGARKVPEVAREVASEVKRGGVVDTASVMAKAVYSKYETAAKELYSKYEPVAEQRAVSAWHKVNKLPLVAQMVVPTASYCSDKYNETVARTAEKGYRVSAYLPLVPTERIAKVFGNEMADVNSE